jgi:hypothetical protein
MNRNARDADDQSIFLSTASRQAGLTGRIDATDGSSQVFAEIAYPPFNIVMATAGGSSDPKLFDVTWFKNFSYREEARVKLKLNNLAVTTYFPADYRSRRSR